MRTGSGAGGRLMGGVSVIRWLRDSEEDGLGAGPG